MRVAGAAVARKLNRMKWVSAIFIAALCAAATIAMWAWANRPSSEAPWPKEVQGMAFSPFHADQSGNLNQYPSDEQLEADLKLLSGKVHALRTYGTGGTLADVPRLAAKYGISVAVGAWLDKDRATNSVQVDKAIELARHNRNVVRVFIGNEVMLRNDLPLEELTAHLDRARAALDTPVGTAETWHTWLQYPELARHCDFLAVHLLPYWEGMDVEKAVDASFENLKRVERAYPGRPVIIGEVGWPSDGRTRGSAVASAANEALFLRRFLARAGTEKQRYYIMEAFDQPWKADSEGGVGAYWGVFDVDRQAKFEFTAPIVRIPEWHLLAGTSVTIALLLLALFYVHSGQLRTRGRTMMAVVVYAAATAAVWVIYDYTQQYLTLTTVIVGALLILGMLGVIAVLFAEAHEWAEAHWIRGHERLLDPSRQERSYLPKVSVHVPAYNEPPDMLIETLNALSRLDYPDFEVLVIDNNTRDEAVWRPVEAHCQRLGARFRFFHVSPLAGFKAGALNFALRQTASDAEVVAVIDSDYCVAPGWLRDLVPSFAAPNMAIVQAPQDYRDEHENAFKSMCYAEYRGFFHIGMITRNERNAIIQHGTMTLVRRRVLAALRGWAEWCICEDAELGLRVFEAGYQATYIPRSYGRGLMPDTFIDYKKQRFRWAYGAMQILRHHAGALLRSGQSTLSAGQRYHFIAGWLPWLADGFNLIFNLAAIGWSAAMILRPGAVDPPLLIFSLLPLSLFTFKLVKLVHLYTHRVGVGLRQTFAAALAGLALAHTIGRAVLKGLVTRSEPFFRTPKRAGQHALWLALAGAWEEAALMLALWGAAFALHATPTELASPDRHVWVIALVIQSIPYTAAVLVSLTSALKLPSTLLERRALPTPPGGALPPAPEP
jgi:exo-beta-1,3-glucanase (GH17 family)/cellulose synthase/poly-beta-1,6-N-acetylglucosamine synthase-like glycosyltransferase